MRILLVLIACVSLLAMPAAALAQQTVVFRAVSKGNQSGYAEFWKDGVRFYRRTGGGGGGRGFNVAVVDRTTGDLLQPVAHFDTWITRTSGVDMGQFVDYLINQIPNGALVLIAVCDEAGLTYWAPSACQRLPYGWIDQAYETLETLGTTTIRSYCYWYGWAFAAMKGEGAALAERLSSGPGEEVSVETTVVLPVEPTTWGQIKAVYSLN